MKSSTKLNSIKTKGLIGEYDSRKYKKVRNIVNNLFGLDIMTKSRQRQYVNARMIYSKILRDQNHTYKSIAFSLRKNHASILHYVKSIDWLLSYDKDLLIKYKECIELLGDDSNEYSQLTKAELIFLVKKLKKQNNLLSLSTNV